MHCRYDSICTPPMHTDTSHTQGCALNRYENCPQRWLWNVIPGSASIITPNEHEQQEHERLNTSPDN